nr:hypothetical protein [Gemmatimonadota bacterium]NIR89815.1 hypothetical protein [Gammaproteobacteria bacterium]NIT67715.1 hypothetical protein [Gemmatimonadota bacterium]NIV24144.1 hypothetical protein [Gemmatimonadota bacterium]NIW76063.1 hypothetical protein [Gemmatimonadota bacterium]
MLTLIDMNLLPRGRRRSTRQLAPGRRATRGMDTPLEVSLRIETFVLAAPAGAESTQGQGVSG